MMPRGIVNLSQNADFTGGSSKPWVPTLIRSSALYHQKFKKGLIGRTAGPRLACTERRTWLGCQVAVDSRFAGAQPERHVHARWGLDPLAARRRVHFVGFGISDASGAMFAVVAHAAFAVGVRSGVCVCVS